MRHSWQALRIVVEALRPDGGGTDAAARRLGHAEWTAPLALANAHLVAPSVYANLLEAGRLGDLPKDVRDYLDLVHGCNGERNAALRRQALELIGGLRGAGVPLVLLKGAASLFLDHYRDPAERMLRDIDVLVPRRAAGQAFDVLRDLGYEAEIRYPPGHHAYADFTRPDDPGAVDLHFELVDPKYILPAGEIWQRARSASVDGHEFLVPSPTDLMLHHVLHAQIHYLGNFYRGVLDLRQLHEFATLTRHYGAAIDWPFIARRMAQYRLDVPLQSYALATERLLGLPWPLGKRPGIAAHLHYRRCVAQFHLPALAWLGIPWGNLRSSFAGHRLNALYGAEGRLLPKMARHAAQYLEKHKADAVIGRLFRVR
ncbi:MAG: nucleotidyltransferase family protein [Rhodospirillales bacterium]|nr:nucleotidyltransferase family protein [Rhodospirillales bacterium]